LDAGQLPVEDLAVLASREGRRPRPIYGAHRWFARRFGSAFRALLTAAEEAEFVFCDQSIGELYEPLRNARHRSGDREEAA
jgi:hypothetical protein